MRPDERLKAEGMFLLILGYKNKTLLVLSSASQTSSNKTGVNSSYRVTAGNRFLSKYHHNNYKLLFTGVFAEVSREF